jgi:predicted nucleic acid-binding protein
VTLIVKKTSELLAFDSNALIYTLQRVQPYTDWLDPVFEAIHLGDRDGVISVVTQAEVLVRPLYLGDRSALERAGALFSLDALRILDVDQNIAIKAAEIRANLGLKLPDAMIVATAILAGCDALVGNDRRCARRVTEIPYIYLDEAVGA